MKKLVLTLCSYLFLFPAFSQTSNVPFEIGIEIQAYPTGIIPGIHLEYAISDKESILTRIGYNIVRHRDLGEHEDERGGGFGFTLGYRRYFQANRSRFFLGGRSDVWFNTIDWKDNIDRPNEVIGTTTITVLQPTVEGGYVVPIGSSNWVFVPTIALGAEINVQTKGAAVGQGAIILAGLTLGKRF